MDQKKYRKKVLLALAGSPVTLLPVGAGITGLMAAGILKLGILGGLIGFGGVIAILLGLGIFATRALAGGGNVARRVLDEHEAEQQAAKERSLDALAARLDADGDPRTTEILSDLRALTRTVLTGEALRGLNRQSVLDIQEGTAKLFADCVATLERTLALQDEADQLSGRARTAKLRERDRIIKDLTRTIARLGAILDEADRLSTGSVVNGSQNERLKDLEASLAVAKRVEERMKDLDLDNHLNEHDAQTEKE